MLVTIKIERLTTKRDPRTLSSGRRGRGWGHGSLRWGKACPLPSWRGALLIYGRGSLRVPVLGFLQSGDTQASVELNTSLMDTP